MIRTSRVVEVTVLLLLGGCSQASETGGPTDAGSGTLETETASPSATSTHSQANTSDDVTANPAPEVDTEEGDTADDGAEPDDVQSSPPDTSDGDDTAPAPPPGDAGIEVTGTGSEANSSGDSTEPIATEGGDADAGDAFVEERGANVFDRDQLHVVSINVAPEDLASLDEHTETRVPASFVFDGVLLSDVGVRNKGQTSFQSVAQKPGFSVKFDEFVDGQKLDGLKKLLLNNTTQDPTWCNETLTYETYRRAGLPAPRIAFAVVTLNGEPKGIYSIGEAVNEQFLSRHYGKDMNQGNLYEGPWDFSDSVDAADLKDEADEGSSRDDLRELQAIVTSEPDDGFAERLAARLDVDQFLLGYAIDAVTVAWDGYAYDGWNYYLYDYPGDNRFLFLPAGANWPYFRDAPDAAPTVDPRVLTSLWGGGKDPASFLAGARVQRIPALDARFEALVRDVTHDVFDVSALHADFDRIGDVLHLATDPDAATARDLEIFDSHVELAYDFVEARKAYLVEQFPR